MPPTPATITRDTGIVTEPSRGGRPTREAAAQLAGRILSEATSLFLRDGYASTSMEAMATAAGVSKRTLYKRFPDKAALLRAAVTDLIQQRWLPPFDQAVAAPVSVEGALLLAAKSILAVALTPEALALHRLMVAEGARFPELSQIMQQAGTNLGITRIAAMLKTADPVWAAEQFQRLVLTGPQHRALGLGRPLDQAELDDWAQKSVQLFLTGVGGEL